MMNRAEQNWPEVNFEILEVSEPGETFAQFTERMMKRYDDIKEQEQQ